MSRKNMREKFTPLYDLTKKAAPHKRDTASYINLIQVKTQSDQSLTPQP